MAIEKRRGNSKVSNMDQRNCSSEKLQRNFLPKKRMKKQQTTAALNLKYLNNYTGHDDSSNNNKKEQEYKNQ